MTTWTDVVLVDTQWRSAQRGYLYAGYRGVYAGALTVPLQSNGDITDTDFYAGLTG